MKNIEVFKFLFCLLVINIFDYVNSFNLSPKSNSIFTLPRIKRNLHNYESSYFGFSVNLREKSLMVGSPKAQSSLNEQQNIVKFGEVYKCIFTTGNCESYHMDVKGNEFYRQSLFRKKYELIKDNQWMGAVMDGSKSENDPFVVCAPNIVTNDNSMQEYFFNGVCYLTLNTKGSQPRTPNTMSALRQEENQYKFHSNFYSYGEQGFSLHVAENSEEILMGAPGVYNWRGAVIRYQNKKGYLGRSYYEIIIGIYSDIQQENIQPDHSYFGYAVTSGYMDSENPKKLIYVSSAPRGNNLKGVVFIYEFQKDPRNLENQMKIYKRFFGTQIGEYFGYALLTEDFNNDGLIDLAISAPLHSKTSSHDNGRVYILYNTGKITFSNYQDLNSNEKLNGRFGTSLGKIGDINRDGFNDLAVGAPFEDNGAVYIFLGSSTGLMKKPCQKITSVAQDPIPFGGNHMFGMSISRGVDIDGNKYNDIVIGAPNVDAVYVYKSYPVVQIISTIESISPEIGLNDTEFTVRACFKYSSPTTIPFNISINTSVTLDNENGRAKFVLTKENIFSSIINLSKPNMRECLIGNVTIEYLIADIFKPFSFELSVDLLNKSPNSSDFCDQCVARNPTDETVVRNSIQVSTGCKSIVCVADLIITSSLVDTNFSIPYIIGSRKTISIEYIVENTGEKAYGAHVIISIPKYLKFYRISSNCIQVNFSLKCQFVSGLQTGQKERINVQLDSSNLYGKELVIEAVANSSGNDRNDHDNVITDIIPLQEFSEIEIHGKSSPLSISMEGVPTKIFNITHQFEIRNLGPSNIKQMKFNFYIPSVFDTSANFEIINVESIVSKEYNYKNKDVNIVWTTVDRINNKYNHYQNASNQYDSNFPNVYVDRKLFLSCDDEGVINCLKGTLDIQDFESGNTPINIEITFSIDLNKVETDERDLLIFITSSEIIREGDGDGTTLKIINFSPYTVFTINNTPSIPIILCIVSAVVGILLLLLMSAGMSKMGFFQRNIQNEMEILKNNVKAYECDAPFAL